MHQDPLDTCPYDPVHRIIRSRMPYHLHRCSQNFPCSSKRQCPFDACHLVNPIEYNYHVSTCQGRESVVHYKISKINEEQQKILPIETEPVAASVENWDDEPEVRSYNPVKSTQNRAIVRSVPIGLSKTKRREFRMQERQRIQQIEENNERQEKQAAKVDTKVKTPVDEYKPLRRPKKLQSETLNSSALTLNSSFASAVGETQLKKPITESQANANISKELNKTKEVQEIPIAPLTKIIPNKTEYTQLRRPKMLPPDTLSANTSGLSLNTSNSLQQVQPTTVNEVTSCSQLKSVKKADISAPNAVPFSYAAALSKKTNKIDEEDQFVEEKENISENSFFSASGNDSIINKLSKTVEELAMDDEGHRKKTEKLDKEIEKLKNLKSKDNTKLKKCAAQFATPK